MLAVYSLPIILANVFQQVYALVDMAIVGRLVGYEALSGVGATNGLSFLLFGFASGVTAGFGICVAQFFGAKDYASLRRSVATSLRLSLQLSLALTAIALAFCGPMLRLMGTPEAVFGYSLTYISVIFAGTLAQVAYNMMACILRSLGDSRTPLLVLIFSVTLNVGLDLLFIGVFGWGVAGAAWATTISQGISAVISAAYAFRHYPMIRPQRGDWHLTRAFAWHHLRIGLPMAFQFSITAVGILLLQAALNRFPVTYMAGFTAANKVQNLGATVSIAFGMAMANYAGQNIGAGRMDRVRAGVRASLWITMVVCVVCAAVMVVFARPLTALFVGETGAGAAVAAGSLAEIFEAAREYLVCSAVFFPFLYVIFIFRNALQGIGKPFWPLMGGVFELVIRAFAAAFLPQRFGYNGIVLIDTLAWVGAALLLVIAYFCQIHRTNPKY